MANNANVMSSIKTFLERMKAFDEAIPEELAEDALEMVEGVKDALCEDEETEELEIKDGCGEMKDEDIDKKVADAVTRALRNAGLIKDSAISAIDEELEALEKSTDEDEVIEEVEDVDGEEDVTVDPAKMSDTANELRRNLQAIKPLIASIPNARDRKRAADAVVKLAKISRGNVYGDILKVSRKAADESIANHNASVATNDYDLGKQWAEKFNPHYMKEGK